ncbi:MAG: hypothetical protein RR235_08680 [Oscillospiraceae bacterium]
MSTWTKADGAKIQLTFTQPLIGTITGNQAHFTVSVPEYDYVPGGTLGSVVKAVLSTCAGNDTKTLILEMEPLQRFESAAGAITVDYDGAGTLAGAGGAVKAFTKAFAPAGLVPKPDQNDAEHLELSVAAAGTLTRIYYRDAKEEEHIELSVSAVGKLTNIKDI